VRRRIVITDFRSRVSSLSEPVSQEVIPGYPAIIDIGMRRRK